MVKVNKIRGLIVEKQLTIQKVAELMDISVNTLSRKLNGKGDFGTEEAQKLIEILDIKDPTDIFFGN